jgi:thioredoxin reductase (NADPH)
MALMGRAFSQAQKFGVELAIPDEAIRLGVRKRSLPPFARHRRADQARSVVLAMGARYRRLAVDRLDEFEGASVHYWASPLEAELASGQQVTLIGGGNSAGQATVFLAGHASHVTLVARRPLRETMSQYLIERIESLPNVSVVIGAEVSDLEGADGALEAIRLRADDGQRNADRMPLSLFLHRGEPNTDWLRGSGLKLDRARVRDDWRR